MSTCLIRKTCGSHRFATLAPPTEVVEPKLPPELMLEILKMYLILRSEEQEREYDEKFAPLYKCPRPKFDFTVLELVASNRWLKEAMTSLIYEDLTFTCSRQAHKFLLRSSPLNFRRIKLLRQYPNKAVIIDRGLDPDYALRRWDAPQSTYRPTGEKYSAVYAMDQLCKRIDKTARETGLRASDLMPTSGVCDLESCGFAMPILRLNLGALTGLPELLFFGTYRCKAVAQGGSFRIIPSTAVSAWQAAGDKRAAAGVPRGRIEASFERAAAGKSVLDGSKKLPTNWNIELRIKLAREVGSPGGRSAADTFRDDQLLECIHGFLAANPTPTVVLESNKSSHRFCNVTATHPRVTYEMPCTEYCVVKKSLEDEAFIACLDITEETTAQEFAERHTHWAKKLNE